MAGSAASDAPVQAAHTLDLSGSRRDALRAGRAGADGEGGTPLAEIEAMLAEQQPGAGLRADRLRAAARRRAGPSGQERAPSAACWPPTCPARAGSRLARRATISSACMRCPDAARPSSPAAAWSRTSRATTCRRPCRLVGHACRRHRPDLQGAARRRDRDDAGDSRPLPTRTAGRRAMALSMGSSAEVSGAAHLPHGIAGRVAGGVLGATPPPCCASRVSGRRSPTGSRIQGFAEGAGSIDEIEAGAVARRLARRARLHPLRRWHGKAGLAHFDAAVGRPRMVYALRMEAAAEAFYDWQGGLIWLRIDGEPEAEAVRRLVRGMAAATRRWCARRPPIARRCRSSSRNRRRSPRSPRD